MLQRHRQRPQDVTSRRPPSDAARLVDELANPLVTGTREAQPFGFCANATGGLGDRPAALVEPPTASISRWEIRGASVTTSEALLKTRYGGVTPERRTCK
jgi:hypothetical protein